MVQHDQLACISMFKFHPISSKRLGFRYWLTQALTESHHQPSAALLFARLRGALEISTQAKKLDFKMPRARAEHSPRNSEGLPSPSDVPFHEWQTRARDYKSSELEEVALVGS